MVLTADRPSIIGYDQDLWAARCQYEQADIWAAEQQFVAIRRSNLRILGLTSETSRGLAYIQRVVSKHCAN